MGGYKFFAFDNFVISEQKEPAFLDLSINKKTSPFIFFLEEGFAKFSQNTEIRFYFAKEFLPEAKDILAKFVESVDFSGRVLVCADSELSDKNCRMESQGSCLQYGAGNE